MILYNTFSSIEEPLKTQKKPIMLFNDNERSLTDQQLSIVREQVSARKVTHFIFCVRSFFDRNLSKGLERWQVVYINTTTQRVWYYCPLNSTLEKGAKVQCVNLVRDIIQRPVKAPRIQKIQSHETSPDNSGAFALLAMVVISSICVENEVPPADLNNFELYEPIVYEWMVDIIRKRKDPFIDTILNHYDVYKSFKKDIKRRRSSLDYQHVDEF